MQQQGLERSQIPAQICPLGPLRTRRAPLRKQPLVGPNQQRAHTELLSTLSTVLRLYGLGRGEERGVRLGRGAMAHTPSSLLFSLQLASSQTLGLPVGSQRDVHSGILGSVNCPLAGLLQGPGDNTVNPVPGCWRRAQEMIRSGVRGPVGLVRTPVLASFSQTLHRQRVGTTGPQTCPGPDAWSLWWLPYMAPRTSLMRLGITRGQGGSGLLGGSVS